MCLGLVLSPGGGLTVGLAILDRVIGAIVLWIATVLTLQRNRAQAVLAHSEHRYRRLFETTTDGIIIADARGTVTAINPFLEQLLGYAAPELVGRPLAGIRCFSDAVPPQPIGEWTRMERFHCEHLQLTRKDGRRVDVELVGNAFWVEREKVLQVNVRDITARKQLERYRGDYLAMLTHDIRNPLGVIYGYVDVLQRLPLPAEAEPLVAAIGGNARSIVGLISNYLDLTNIELGELKLERRPLSLSALLARVSAPYRPEAKLRDIAVTVECDDALPRVLGDPRALERVFANLLHNAFKFTPDGGEIHLRATHGADGVRVAVINSGPGIAPHELPLLFGRYQQTETGRARSGMGLGLFIVKSLVEAQGGTVAVDSTPGERTELTVSLRAESSAAGPAPERQ
ncbi:PAS domain S-box protein [bacterium]|nr:PAS domain S-box protein [bacterium]